MNFSEQINKDIKEAMKAKETDKLMALRAIKSEILLANTSGSGGEMNDEAAIKILQKLVKQRKDSAQTYKAAGRTELYEKEIKEVSFIEAYLPEQLSDEELSAIVVKAVEATKATSIRDMGKVMGMVNKQVAGRAEGKVIAMKVKEILGK